MSNNGDKGKEGDQGKGEDKGEKPIVFDDWLKTQPAEVQSLLDTHTKGLKTALNSERERADGVEKQLRDAAKKLKEGSDERKGLEDMADQAATASKQATFYEEAHAAGVTNLKLAFLAAQQGDLFDKKGKVDFDDMKKQFPELFVPGAKPVAGKAGEGTGSKVRVGGGMNDFIRRSTGH